MQYVCNKSKNFHAHPSTTFSDFDLQEQKDILTFAAIQSVNFIVKEREIISEIKEYRLTINGLWFLEPQTYIHHNKD